MAIHLTPTELAREAGMDRRDVIEKCMEMGVPIFQGRIDKTLFLATLAGSPPRARRRRPPPDGAAAPDPPRWARRRHIDSRRRVLERRRDRWKLTAVPRRAATTGSQDDRRPDGVSRPSSTPTASPPSQARRRVARRHLRARSATIVSEIGARPDRPRHRAGRPGLAPVPDAPGVDLRRLRASRARARVVVPDLPDELPGGVRVGGGQLRVASPSSARTRPRSRRSSRSATASRTCARSSSSTPRGSTPGRTRSRSTRCASAAAAADGAELERRRRRRPARGPVHLHLHLGHHGPARRAACSTHGNYRDVLDMVRVGRHHLASDDVTYLFLPLAHSFALLIQLGSVRPGRHDRLLRRRREADRPRAQRGQADLPPVGPADLREDLHARHRAAGTRTRHPGGDRRSA